MKSFTLEQIAQITGGLLSKAEDVFEKINPENKMEKVKNKIQIAIDTMTEKLSK